MTTGLIIILVVVVGGAAIALASPVHVDLEMDMAVEPPTRQVRVRVRWLTFAWGGGEASRAPARSAPRRPGRRRARSDPRRALAAIRTRGFAGRLGRLACELLHALAPRTVDGWLKFGLEDPVTTGVIFGAAHGAVGVAGSAAWNLRLEPEFADAALAGHARVVWTVRPAAVLWPIGTFVMSPTTWRAALAAMRAR